MSPAAKKVAEVKDDLTAGWEVRQIKDVADVNPRVDKKAIPDDIEVSFVPMPAVEAESGEIDVSQTKLAKEVKKGFTAFLQGDVLFAKITPCMENGKMAIAPALINGYGFGSTEFHVLRPGEGIDAKYLYYYVSGKSFRGEAERFMTGAVGQKRVSTTYIKEATIPVAPLEDQRRIVAEIEKQFSRLDEAVASLKRAKANVKRYKAAVLKAAVEGKLTEEWRKQNPAAEPASKLLDRILDERRTQWEEAELAKMKAKGKEPKNDKWKDKYPVPAAPAESGSHDMPSTWELVSLEAITSATRVICYGILMPKAHIEDGVPYVKVRDMKGDKVNISGLNRTSPEIAIKYQRASLKYGDLLLSIRGTYGRVADVPRELEGGNITQDTVRIDFSRHCDRAFMAVSLRSPRSQQYFKRVARGVAVKGINVADVRATPTLFPPPDEQVAIASIAEQAVSRLSVLEAEVDVAVLHANRLRQSVLARAFRGSY